MHSWDFWLGMRRSGCVTLMTCLLDVLSQQTSAQGHLAAVRLSGCGVRLAGLVAMSSMNFLVAGMADCSILAVAVTCFALGCGVTWMFMSQVVKSSEPVRCPQPPPPPPPLPPPTQQAPPEQWPQAPQPAPPTCTVMCQSPVTFKWHLKEPRFVPLGLREHGAWNVRPGH